MTANIGFCFDRTFPAPEIVGFARRLEAGGADQIWIIEDCFYTAGISLAATVAAVTERLNIGLGILPAVARNPAITAMEIATLAALAPGRLLAGIGHGVQSWMEQIGERTPSPLTTLEEVIVAVRRLLAGETVTVHGRHVRLDDVRLAAPPTLAPPILAGVRGPKSIAMAGRVADGLVLAEPGSPSYVRWSLEQARAPGPFHTAVFSSLCVAADRQLAYRIMAPWLAGLLSGDPPNPGLNVLPFYADLVEVFRRSGVDGLAKMPSDWWMELGPIGTLDDAAEHLEALERAGADSIGLFPAPDLAVASAQLDDVTALVARQS